MTKQQQWETKILHFLRSQKGTAFKQKRIAKKLGIAEKDYPDFKGFLKGLAAAGRIERGHKHVYRFPDPSQSVAGKISFSAIGFAFVSTDEEEEIFVGAYDTGVAMHGDRVLVEKYRKQSGKLPEGKVTQIIQRSQNPVYAVAKKEHGKWWAIPEPPAALIKIQILGETAELRTDQLIEIEQFQWEHPREKPTAQLRQILGLFEDPRDDITIIKKMYRLDEKFPAAVQRESDSIPAGTIQNEIAKRLDLRDQEIFTIDPADARDFDDAVSLQRGPKGQWLLGVHIADVSHFVSAGSRLDREARNRGTSIYFSEQVVPMLPERLSNQLCSLQPDEDRLAFSVLMRLTDAGEIISCRIEPSVIRSRKRFSYTEAHKILEEGTGPHSRTLAAMDRLSRALRRKRSASGSVDFDLPEAIFTILPNGVPSEVRLSERLATHRLIEEFMLLANKTVAEHIAVYQKEQSYPFVYRIHEPPTEEAINGLYDILHRLGFRYPKARKFTPAVMQKILADVEESPFRHFIEQIALRSMSKAVYSSRCGGHFGLAFSHYTHFTSPIRRYPDLVVHRLLKAYRETPQQQDLQFYRRSIPQIAKQSTENEIRALEAEREYRKLKQIRFLAHKIGEWYEGIITGVLEFGFFVEISDFIIEGLVHVRTLDDDYYVYDKASHWLKGRRSGRVFRLGDRVKVMVAEVSVKERRIDLLWGE